MGSGLDFLSMGHRVTPRRPRVDKANSRRSRAAAAGAARAAIVVSARPVVAATFTMSFCPAMAMVEVVGPAASGAQNDSAEQLHVPRNEVEGEEGPDEPLPIRRARRGRPAGRPTPRRRPREVAAQVECGDVRLREGDERVEDREGDEDDVELERGGIHREEDEPTQTIAATARFCAKTMVMTIAGSAEQPKNQQRGYAPARRTKELHPLAHHPEREEPAQRSRRDEGDEQRLDGGRKGTPRGRDAAGRRHVPGRSADTSAGVGNGLLLPLRPAAGRRRGRPRPVPALSLRPPRTRTAPGTSTLSSHGARTWR